MRTVVAIVCYVVGVLVVGALLAPALDGALRALVHAGLLQGLADTPFRRVADRSFMLVALVGLYPLLRSLSLRARSDWGYGAPLPALARTIAGGLGLGLLTMLLVVGLECALRLRAWTEATAAGELAGQLGCGLLAGAMIALIEETFFRGALYSAVRRGGGFVVALTVTAGLYALLHFMRTGDLAGPVTWDAGFRVLRAGLAPSLGWHALGPLAALLLVGICLALLREDYGHVGWGIGLHAGWVTTIHFVRWGTDLRGGSSLVWLVTGYDGVTGWLAFFVLAPLLGGYLFWRRRKASSAAPGGAP